MQAAFREGSTGAAAAGRGHHVKIIGEREKVKMLWSLLFISLIALCNTQRLPLNGTKTSQKSNYTDANQLIYSSARATDGNMTTCAITGKESDPWWRIDLLRVCNISCITIYNTAEDNTDISGAQIHIGSSRENNTITNSICENITNFKKNNSNNFTCNTTMSGRYITVFYPGNKPLILCEVMIYGTITDPPFVLINESKTWEEALYYCRDNYMDLASIVDEDTQAWAELEAKKANTPFVWLGLHYTCTLEFWFWVDDQRLDFNRWKPEKKRGDCGMSGAMETREEHLWFSTSDYETFYFICAK
ncbi:fucolectin-1-like isoform X2 [Micropterus salmoides]|uniref:fucolectin-1-like isoform X2 n=1 Tax=Micropterus salmoides TaxID=27706 RepID=UPI0018EAF0E8|nr:fucolectin-1-like isoform X2 [Micropterus salmoides]